MMLSLFLLLFCVARGIDFSTDHRKCERITLPFCLALKRGYNYTSMPNLVNLVTQSESMDQLKSYEPLLKVGCSSKLRLFLCTMYTPMCTKIGDDVIIVKPCRKLCESVRNGCLTIITQFMEHWPENLNCEQLKDDNMCMIDEGENDEKPKQNIKTKHNIIDFIKLNNLLGIQLKSTNKPPDMKCPQRYTYVQSYREIDVKSACAPRCNVDVFFSYADKKFAKIWTLVCSAICVVSTSLLLITYLMDTTRFRYPERPIIAIAFCYFIYAGTHLVSALIGRNNISCNDLLQDSSVNSLYILQSGVTQKTYCVTTFILSYYTTMASASWWVILTITWFLAASHKWSREAISSIAVYCHLFAWSVPALMTAGVLAIRKVDGDLYVGVCGVGNLDRLALTWFVLVPLFTFLLVGIWFILAGYAAMCRIRNDLRSDGLNIRKLEKLMAKIGIFSIMYVVPVAITISCNFYIAMRLPDWLKISEQNCATFDCPLIQPVANTRVYMLRVFASLFVGSITGTWIWTPKTMETWKRHCSGSSPPTTGQKPTLTLESLRQHEAMAKKEQYHPVNTTDLAKL